jgi:hypothetical protein
MADRDLNHLHPVLRHVVEALLLPRLAVDALTGPGKVIETYRDESGQAVAWAKGRNTAGEVIDKAAVVTWKRPGDSLHQLRRRSHDGLMVPASLAVHVALYCQGCHPSGTLLGLGPHEALSRADLARYQRMAEHGQALGLRSGMDWDGDRVYLERGENDLMHLELVVGPLAQVKAVLEMGGELQWPTGGLHA